MLMRYLFLYIIMVLAAVGLAACGNTAETPASKAELILSKAEQCAAQGDDTHAFQYAISLTNTSEYDLMPSQLCRQALVLYRISNEGEDVERLVASLTCYERAMATDPDSVEAFINALDTDDRSDMKFVHDLNLRLNHPQDYSEYEEGEPADSSLLSIQP